MASNPSLSLIKEFSKYNRAAVIAFARMVHVVKLSRLADLFSLFLSPSITRHGRSSL